MGTVVVDARGATLLTIAGDGLSDPADQVVKPLMGDYRGRIPIVLCQDGGGRGRWGLILDAYPRAPLYASARSLFALWWAKSTQET